MASNINYNNIDQTFPVAGVDNDSQGFRTNFLNIKNNLQYAKSEIEDLQNKVILKSALNGTTLNNNLSGSQLSGAVIYDFREMAIDLGSVSGTITLDHAAAPYYMASTTDVVNVNFVNLPSNGSLGRIRLKIVVNSTSHTLTLPAAVSLGTDSIEGLSGSTISFASTGAYIFEFTTDDQGSSIHIADLTRPRRPTVNSTKWNSLVSNFNRYNYASVTNNFNLNVVNNLLIDSNSSVTTGTVYLPSSPQDGQICIIATNNAVSSVSIRSNIGSLILGSVTSLGANSNVKYQFVSSANKWFKI
jgi:hypothetical protein